MALCLTLNQIVKYETGNKWNWLSGATDRLHIDSFQHVIAKSILHVLQTNQEKELY